MICKGNFKLFILGRTSHPLKALTSLSVHDGESLGYYLRQCLTSGCLKSSEMNHSLLAPPCKMNIAASPCLRKPPRGC